MQAKQTTKYQDTTGKEHTVHTDSPNTCPLCHEKINPHFMAQNYLTSKNILQLLWRCNNKECENLFIEDWQADEHEGHNIVLVSVKPKAPKSRDFSEHIVNISPQFVQIYNDAAEAEAQELLNIAGPGFRKAFEFLIKDYAKSLADEDQHETIEQTFSGQVVQNYVNDPRIRTVAERALWLGNDETHYLRRWQDHDLNDLKKLIDLTIHYIEIEILSQGYESDMQPER